MEELGGADPPLLADGSVDDDALIEAALAEAGEEEEVGDEEEEEEEEEQPGAASPAAAAAAGAAAPAAAEPKFVGETYISESGEVMRRRAPRKKKVVEKDSVDAVQLEAERKATAEVSQGPGQVRVQPRSEVRSQRTHLISHLPVCSDRLSARLLVTRRHPSAC